MLEKVISGGQTGADIAGVMTAYRFGIATGGTMPKGFLTQAGPKPEWAAKYGFVEHESPKYPPRTFKNVMDADATIRFAADFESSGEKLTLKAIQQYKKPHMDVDVIKPRSLTDILDWFKRHDIKVLNVAGNSERTFDGIGGEVMEYLSRLFISLNFKEVPGLE
jgi:hypothetical protein